MKLRTLEHLALLGIAMLVAGCKPDILSPEPNSAFERQDGPVEITFGLYHDADAELEFQFTRSDLDILNQNDRAGEWLIPTPVHTVKTSPRRSAVTWAFDRSGHWRIRARNRDDGNAKWSDWRPFLVLDQGQASAAARLSLEPSEYAGPCPVTIEARGIIGSAVPGKVRYWFRRSDGHASATEDRGFAAPGTMIARTRMPAVGAQNGAPTSGWLELVVKPLPDGPEVASPQATYQVTCSNVAPTDP
jgi:hypothetical protein